MPEQILLEAPSSTFEDVFGSPDMSAINSGVPDVSSGDGVIRTYTQCCEWADKIDCNVLVAKDNQLFIDIDTEYQYEIFKQQMRRFKYKFTCRDLKITPSRQGLPHRHIVVLLDRNYPLITRIAMQSCLGSDPIRELISLYRAEKGDDNVVLLFEKKTTPSGGRMIEI